MFKGVEIDCGGGWHRYECEPNLMLDDVAGIQQWWNDTKVKYPNSLTSVNLTFVIVNIYGERKLRIEKLSGNCKFRSIVTTIVESACNTEGELIFGCMIPTATNYNPMAQVDDGSCVFEPNISGVIAGRIKISTGVTGDNLDGFEADPNICVPAVYYAIIAKASNNYIIAQSTFMSHITASNWLKAKGDLLNMLNNDLYIAAIYGECGSIVNYPTESVGADFTTIVWPQLDSIMFQGAKP